MDTTECLFLSRAMSALGQKQTCAPQQAMSALAPIATSIAFFGMSAWAKSGHLRCKRACPLYPRKRTLCGPSKSAFGYRFMSTRPSALVTKTYFAMPCGEFIV
jgi:hypothetical protein